MVTVYILHHMRERQTQTIVMIIKHLSLTNKK